MKLTPLRAAFSLVALLASGMLFTATAQSTDSDRTAGKLKAYFVDVEGGQSTLFVTPAGQSLLVDTGWPGNENRDADRIVAVAKLAGISRIDYVLLTHYHDDHVGGLPQLVAQIPIGTFIDHGANRDTVHRHRTDYSARPGGSSDCRDRPHTRGAPGHEGQCL